MGKALRASVGPAGTSLLSRLGASCLSQSPAHKSGITSQNAPLLINVPTCSHLARAQSGDGDTVSLGTLPQWHGWEEGFIHAELTLGSLQCFLSSTYLRSRLLCFGMSPPPRSHRAVSDPLGALACPSPCRGLPKRLHSPCCWHTVTLDYSPTSPPDSSVLRTGPAGKTSSGGRPSSGT